MAQSSQRRVLGVLVLLVLVVAMAGAAARLLGRPVDPMAIALNDMTDAAGRVQAGVATVALEARAGDWRPNGADGFVLRVAAFAEAGGRMQVPGPLVRVPAGTQVQVRVRNALDVPLTIYGLGAERGLDRDSAQIAPGAEHEFRFSADEPGIYYYAGRTMPEVPLLNRFDFDSQLNGAIVVDPPGERPRDRLFMITAWGDIDRTTVSGLQPNSTLAINGAMWPYTEEFEVEQGDSLHWRWLNPTFLPHPMHLHGFYFRKTGSGDGASWQEIAPEGQRLAVTELLEPGGVMAVSWSPSRPGNWVFHCHFAGHIASEVQLEQDRRHPHTRGEAVANPMGGPSASADDRTHGVHNMSGLVLGIKVRPRGPQAEPAEDAQTIRLLVRSAPNVYGEYAGWGYVLGGSAEESDPDAFSIPGPLLVLEKDRRVGVTIVNQSHEAAAVHWHGIELESYPDGIPGWSGQGRNILPAIPPGDSLTVHFTAPRAGTFMYHSHFNEFQQIASGMYGGIVVLEPGQRLDPETDRVMVFSDGGPIVNFIEGPFPPGLLNGQEHPGPIELRAGVTHRLRMINIHAEKLVQVELADPSGSLVTWRILAKDGAAMEPQEVPSSLMFASGEIWDVEVTPRAGPLVLRFGLPPFLPDAPPLVAVPVNVR